MTTIYDIAKKAGVSPATVSKVLNNQPDVGQKTREKVIGITQELGYKPNATARGLATKKSYTIGIFFQDHLNSGFRHPFFQDVLASFKDVVGEAGYDLIFFANRNPDSFESLARYRNVDGLFLLGVPRNHPELSSLEQSMIPCMSVDLDLLGPRAAYLTSDNIGGAVQAVDYLVSKGHTQISFVADVFSTKPGHDRLMGFYKAMNHHGLEVKSKWILSGDFSEEGGYQSTQKLLESDEIPTAIFCAGDIIAIGSMQAIREAGLQVEKDISIIGFDDLKLLHYITPKLTTIRQNKEEMGAKAAVGLLKMMKNPNYSPSMITVPTELVIRDTVSKLKE